MMALLVLGWATTLACATNPPANLQLRALDSSRSHADFEVKVLWLIGLHGDFGKVEGTLAIDRFRSQIRVDARINASDVHMRSRNYETWARSSEFFDAAHYPQIHFISESFPLARVRTGGKIDGSLTLRGINRQVRFELDPATCATPLAGGCAVEARGSIRRSQFGMHSRRGTLADKVQLHLSIWVLPVAQAAEPAP